MFTNTRTSLDTVTANVMSILQGKLRIANPFRKPRVTIVFHSGWLQSNLAVSGHAGSAAIGMDAMVDMIIEALPDEHLTYAKVQAVRSNPLINLIEVF